MAMEEESSCRISDVALYASSNSPPYNMRFLNNNESWDLLKEKVFQDENCPTELEGLGITKLPRTSSSNSASWWAPCQGFLKPCADESLDDVGEKYLQDLTDRSIVLVSKRKLSGKTKTCSIHDLVRDLCVREAQKEKFVRTIKADDDLSSEDAFGYRRLCLHSSILHYDASIRRDSIIAAGEFPRKNMTAIGSLHNLEILKLRFCSLQDDEWELSEGEFYRLKILVLEGMNIVQWRAETDHFPSLEQLIVNHCRKLEEIPPGFGDTPTLQLIKVVGGSRSCENSAMLFLGYQQQSLGNLASK
ncbi:UNVERIFIED_CONTAM: hypothetical protein Sradi_2055600 [Sesamum radiatum]|uniref:Disease resistance protein winged helix domain-containing protein n=1 Tax=Sesamum radiatum TaxID=300843 RepID=A0AAW2TJ07_SESRA